jgi:tRNA dimethylallyltransferase
VKKLVAEGLAENQTACQAIGYRQCLDYLKTNQTQDDWDRFIAEFKQASRRYAKRQFTWFRKEPLFRWLNLHKMPGESAVETMIQDYEQSF